MKIFAILFLFLCAESWSMEQLRLDFPEKEIKQGALVHARLLVTSGAVNLPLQRLKGQTISETLYIQHISPLLRRDGASEYEAEAKIIFITIPQANMLTGKIDETEISFTWGMVNVIPTEVPKEMLWADFTAPDILYRNWRWLILIALFLVIPYPAYLVWKKLNFKSLEKKRKLAFIAEINKCRSYDEVVALWKKKHTYLAAFPHLEPAFVELEKVLFRVQFKPSQSDQEKSQVINAYQKFLTETEGGFRGI